MSQQTETGSGFYAIDNDGVLLYAANTLSTPSGTYYVANQAAYTYPLDGMWNYYNSYTDALTQTSSVDTVVTSVQVVSNSDSTLNGSYWIIPDWYVKYNALATYVMAFNTFPASQNTWPIFDATGTPHYFANTTLLLSFCRAIMDYTGALDIGLSVNTPITIP